MSSDTTHATRFRVLDSWRGLAALTVVGYHFTWFFGIYLGPFLHDSYLFVDFFFALSGFVISYAYLTRIAEPGEPLRFLIRRFGRVWPLHIVMLAVIIAAMFYIRRPPDLELMTAREGINPILTNIFLVHSLGFHNHLLLNVPSWSISVEFFAYVTFALVAVFARRFMPLVAAVLIAVSMALLYFYAERYMDTHHDFGFFRCLAGFFAGYFMYLAWRRFGGVEGRTLATLLEVAAVAAACWFVTIAGNGTSPVSLLAPAFFAPVVFVFAGERGLLSSLLQRRAFTFLGDISYSIYLTHFLWVLLFPRLIAWASTAVGYPIRLNALRNAPLDFDGGLRIAIAMFFYFALTIALSAVTYHLVEQPGRRFFRRLSDRVGARSQPQSGRVSSSL